MKIMRSSPRRGSGRSLAAEFFRGFENENDKLEIIVIINSYLQLDIK